jgi:hypothetical protein
MKTRLIGGIFALFMAGCGQPQTAYSPYEKKTAVDPKKLFDAAEGTLQDRGFSIATRDAGAFRLVTEPRTLLGSQISKGKYQYAFVVETAGGTLKIELKCQSKSATTDVGPCGDQAPEKLVNEQQQIAQHTLAEAQGK